MARDKGRRAASPNAPASIPHRVRPALIAALCAALAVATLAAYWGVRSNGFVLYDDNICISDNAHVKQGLTGASAAWALTATEAANWHPLTWLSHMTDVQLFGLDAGGHHLTSLLIHVLNAVLLLLVLFRMTGAPWRSAFVAALFALHPLHVESVAWIAERKDVLSTLFWLLTTGAWLEYVRSRRAAPYAWALAFYAMGVMAKPMVVTLPFTLLLLDYWPLRRMAFPLQGHAAEFRKLVWEKAPMFAMAAASSVITVIAQRIGGAVKTMTEFPFDQRAANALHAYAAYLGKMVWPSPLAVYYPHPHQGFTALSIVTAFVALAGITALAFLLGGKAPYLPFGWLWYLGTLVPVIGLVQVGDQAMADRYTYIPLIGIFIAIAWGVGDLLRRRPAARLMAAAASLAVLSPLAVLTRLQTGYWKDTGTLFTHALAATRDNDLANYKIGCLRLEQGRLDEAVAFLAEVVRINPRHAEGHTNLAIALDRMGRTPEALEHFREALKGEPNNTQVMNNLGLALVKAHQLPQAIDAFEEAVKRVPDFADAQNNLGNALAAAGRLEEAVAHYQQALRIRPGSAKTQDNLGLALGRLNRVPEAMDHFQKAVDLDAGFAEARYHLGIGLAHTRRFEEAREQYREALRIRPDYPEARAALENAGKTPDSGPHVE
jgi:protein O-mannosyl-transferase